MRDVAAELLDEDLVRLARLGGSLEQIAEAAGAEFAQVRRRLGAAGRPPRTGRTGPTSGARRGPAGHEPGSRSRAVEPVNAAAHGNDCRQVRL